MKASFGLLEKDGGGFFVLNVEAISFGAGVLGFTGVFGVSSLFFLLLRETCVHSLSRVTLVSASEITLVVLVVLVVMVVFVVLVVSFSDSFGCYVVSAAF